ncbi:hypothetical protein C0991_010517 [Blastosporella zonata]|nr:hypothetical protein C0991_010517 [Blastosporella zonata]
MGVLGLTPFLQKKCPEVIKQLPDRLRELAGKRVVIDGTLITQRLHFAPAPHPYRHVLGWYRLARELQEAGVQAVCVFDGKERNIAKAREAERRREVQRRDQARGALEIDRSKRLKQLSDVLPKFWDLDDAARQHTAGLLRQLAADAEVGKPQITESTVPSPRFEGVPTRPSLETATPLSIHAEVEPPSMRLSVEVDITVPEYVADEISGDDSHHYLMGDYAEALLFEANLTSVEGSTGYILHDHPWFQDSVMSQHHKDSALELLHLPLEHEPWMYTLVALDHIDEVHPEIHDQPPLSTTSTEPAPSPEDTTPSLSIEEQGIPATKETPPNLESVPSFLDVPSQLDEQAASVTETISPTPEPVISVLDVPSQLDEQAASVTETISPTPEPVISVLDVPSQLDEQAASVTETISPTPEPVISVLDVPSQLDEQAASVTDTTSPTPEPVIDVLVEQATSVAETSPPTPGPIPSLIDVPSQSEEQATPVAETAPPTSEPTSSLHDAPEYQATSVGETTPPEPTASLLDVPHQLSTLYLEFRQSVSHLATFSDPLSSSLPIIPSVGDPETQAEIVMTKAQYQLTLEEGRFWDSFAASQSIEQGLGHEREPVGMTGSDLPDALEKLSKTSDLMSASFERRMYPPTSSTYAESKEILRAMGVPCLDTSGAFEAEALASSMVLNGLADYVVSEDTDVLVYDVPLVRNLTNRNTPLTVVSGAEIRAVLQLSQASFIDFALLLGTDFSQRIKNVGPARALKFIREHKTIERVIELEKKFSLPLATQAYLDQVKIARVVFRTLPPVPEVSMLEQADPDEVTVMELLQKYGLGREVMSNWDNETALAGNYFQDNPSAF